MEVHLHANDREGLERLCRYGARGALALDRFEEAEDGRIACRMKRPLPDGTTHLLFTGMELLRRLASLVPPPRMNLTRFHGVFAPGARLRPFPVPATALPGEQEALPAATSRQKRQRAPGLDGAGLLQRTFKVDVFSCPKCAGRRRVLASLTESAVRRRILRHLHLPELPPPLAPARTAPAGAVELSQPCAKKQREPRPTARAQRRCACAPVKKT